MRWRGTWRDARAVALVAALLFVTAAPGCGDEEPAARDAATTDVTTSRATATTEQTATAQDQDDPEDGRLTTKSGKVITDWGEPADGRAAVAALVRLQEAFQAGRMDEACENIDDFLLNQFHPRGVPADAPCADKLDAYASVLAGKGADRPTMKVVWVRSYAGIAGIWIDDDHGRRTRVPFASPVDPDGEWLLELGVFSNPELLNAEMTGTERFGVG